MVKYIEFSNVFQAQCVGKFLVFIADNVLVVDDSGLGDVDIRINDISVEIATVFFNEVSSFVCCFLSLTPKRHYLLLFCAVFQSQA